MKIDLSGKKALIGGSSKGIGLGIAKQLAESGASVCLMARNETKLKELILKLPSSENQNHDYLVVDFSSFDRFKIIIEEYVDNNRIDILINNTQGPPAGTPCLKILNHIKKLLTYYLKV